MSFQGNGNDITIPRGEAAMLAELTQASYRIVLLLGRSFPAYPVLHFCIGSEAFSSHASLERVRRGFADSSKTFRNPSIVTKPPRWRAFQCIIFPDTFTEASARPSGDGWTSVVSRLAPR